MTIVRVPLKGCTRIWIHRDAGVSAQRGLASVHWISHGTIADWLALPFTLIAAIWWILEQ